MTAYDLHFSATIHLHFWTTIDSISVAFLGDVLLRISISRLISGRHQPQVCSYYPALFEAVGIL
jgi:hypothetical protein